MRTVRTAAAALVVVGALLVPRGDEPFTAAAFVRIPLEALLGLALLVLLPTRPRGIVAGALGAVLGLLTVLGLLDRGFRASLDRPFDPVVDTVLLGDAVNFVSGSYGAGAAVAAVIGAGLLAVAVPVVTALAAVHLGRVVAPRRPAALRAAAGLVPIWAACALLGVQLVPGVAVASAGAATQLGSTIAGAQASLADQQRFAAQVAVDAFADTPDAELLTALRGKDVVVAFVESYGRDAVVDPEFAQVGALLDDGTQRLAAGGFAARSGFLTSPVAGGNSWLAHATFHSGLPVTNQARYRTLVASDRRTLPSMFADVGAQTVAVMPGTTGAWPEADFYGYERILDFAALGYQGPDLGWATVPDQYTLSAYHRLAAATTRPQMAELALVTSHAPWPFIPPLLDWAEVGDGSVYDALAPDGPRRTDLSRTEYRRSIEYTLGGLISYVETYGDDDLVLVLLGDHQPLPVITGEGASRDVPISIVTRDTAVLDRIDDWGWDDGLRPADGAPVWPMEAFRDRFLTAFSPQDTPTS